MKLKRYIAPCVKKLVAVEVETDLLAGSVVTPDTQVRATGQQVDSYDFSDTQFNQNWDSGSF